MNILSIGGFSGLGESNTCTLRDKVLQEFGTVEHVDTTKVPYNLHYRICNRLFRLGLNVPLPDLSGANREIKRLVRSNPSHYDVIWIDKGIVIDKTTFKTIKQTQPDSKIIGYSPDWMMGRHNQSRQFIESLPFYDCYVTTKSYAVEEMKNAGCKDVIYIGNAFQKGFHRPFELSVEEHEKYDCEVGFIGAYEEERAESIKYLADNGIRVDIWGNYRWKEFCDGHHNLMFRGTELVSDEYCKALSGCKISLCFLRKMNKDLQTTRSIEIPACGSFMLAERTSEHLDLFKEDEEAVYFSDNQELLDKCRKYLTDVVARKRIAEAGHRRCVSSDYSYHGRIRQILHHVLNG